MGAQKDTILILSYATGRKIHQDNLFKLQKRTSSSYDVYGITIRHSDGSYTVALHCPCKNLTVKKIDIEAIPAMWQDGRTTHIGNKEIVW